MAIARVRDGHRRSQPIARRGHSWARVVALWLMCGAIGAGAAATGAGGSGDAALYVQDAKQLAAVLGGRVEQAFPDRDVRWSLPRPHPFAPEDSTALRLIAPERLEGGRNWFHLEPQDARAGAFLLPVDIAWRDSVWVTARPLAKGHVIGAGDVERRVLWTVEAPGALMRTPPEGMRLLASLPAGAALCAEHLGAPPLLRRGDLVRLVYRGRGLLVTTRGKVLEDGWRAGQVRVQPLDSHRVCQAIVRSAEEVEVLTP